MRESNLCKVLQRHARGEHHPVAKRSEHGTGTIGVSLATCVLMFDHLQAVAMVKAHGGCTNKIWGIASTANDSMHLAIKETAGKSAFQQMVNHFKWDDRVKCRLCPTVASLHLIPPELIELMHGSREVEIGAVQLMKDEAQKPGSSVMGPRDVSKMDSIGDAIDHFRTGSVIFNHNRRGEANATMTGFFTISDASRHIQDGTLDLVKIKTNPYRTGDKEYPVGYGLFYQNGKFRCALNLLAYTARNWPVCS